MAKSQKYSQEIVAMRRKFFCERDWMVFFETGGGRLVLFLSGLRVRYPNLSFTWSSSRSSHVLLNFCIIHAQLMKCPSSMPVKMWPNKMQIVLTVHLRLTCWSKGIIIASDINRILIVGFCETTGTVLQTNIQVFVKLCWLFHFFNLNCYITHGIRWIFRGLVFFTLCGIELQLEPVQERISMKSSFVRANRPLKVHVCHILYKVAFRPTR